MSPWSPVCTRTNAHEAFRDLIIEPLNSDLFPVPGKPVFVIIDALDEAFFPGKDNIPEILCDEIANLPLWFRIIATTRPIPEMIDFLEINSTLLKLSAKKQSITRISGYIWIKDLQNPNWRRSLPLAPVKKM